jgi:hypothetical protein
MKGECVCVFVGIRVDDKILIFVGSNDLMCMSWAGHTNIKEDGCTLIEEEEKKVKARKPPKSVFG